MKTERCTGSKARPTTPATEPSPEVLQQVRRVATFITRHARIGFDLCKLLDAMQQAGYPKSAMPAIDAMMGVILKGAVDAGINLEAVDVARDHVVQVSVTEADGAEVQTGIFGPLSEREADGFCEMFQNLEKTRDGENKAMLTISQLGNPWTFGQ